MDGAPSLGRLLPIAAREVWPDEALDFTPWLLDNVDVLSDLLGMDLVLDEAEHPVGGFRLDLKGYDEATGGVVIVENQLAMSDHAHLGQIITYAAGTDPTTIVWVATGFRPEHRAAIDWLNQRTDESTRVFGVVIHVVRIGDSAPAPNFELVAQPNDWEKEVKKATSTSGGTVSARSLMLREFWDVVLERIRTEHPTWTHARTNGQSWLNITTGLSRVVISLSWTRSGLVAQVYFDSPDADLNSARFLALEAQRPAFDSALGLPAQWDPMDGLKAARVIVRSEYESLEDREHWPSMADWLTATASRFRVALDAIGGVAQLDRPRGS